MALTKIPAILPLTPPTLIAAPATYAQNYHEQNNAILRLYFQKVSNNLNTNNLTQIGGTVTFNGGTQIPVSFPHAFPNLNYYIGLSGNAAGFCWVNQSDKTLNGFIINCSVANFNSMDWVTI